MDLSNMLYCSRRKISQALRENACDVKESNKNSPERDSDPSKVTRNDDFKTHHPLERNNCLALNTCQQSIDDLSNNTMELSRSELEDLLQDFISRATGQDSSIIDLDSSIGTFPIDDMSLSFGNFSTQMEFCPVY